MKKRLFILMVSFFVFEQTKACDICGCGSSGFYLGVLPQFHKNFAGIRYRHQSFRSHIGLHPSLASSEEFTRVELWSRLYINPKWQVMAFVPYQYSVHQTTEKQTTDFGLADVSVLSSYNVLNTTLQGIRKVNHSIWLGGGIKLPTGKYKFSDDNQDVANANFQPGTGSVDFMLNAMYTLRMNRLGLNTEFNYRYNTSNSNNYKFGNNIQSGIQAFYLIQIKNVGIMPQSGFSFESAERNKQRNQTIRETGGNLVFWQTGIDVYYKSVVAGFIFHQPIQNNLAEGRIKANNRLGAQITFLFNGQNKNEQVIPH
jgi:hypothetical protein